MGGAAAGALELGGGAFSEGGGGGRGPGRGFPGGGRDRAGGLCGRGGAFRGRGPARWGGIGGGGFPRLGELGLSWGWGGLGCKRLRQRSWDVSDADCRKAPRTTQHFS